MSLFNFQEQELIAFFMVMVRFATLFAVLPFFGDKLVPGPVRVLLALSISVLVFPVLRGSQGAHLNDIAILGRSVGGIVSTTVSEVLLGLLLGFTAKLVFEGIAFGANLIGNLMGYASATSFDPHQESQTEIIAQLQTTIAMLLFITMDGRHLILKASLNSFDLVGIGRLTVNIMMVERITAMTGQIFSFGLQLAAPMAMALFGVNLVFGLISKALPQMNILILSLSVSGLVGLIVMFIGVPGFYALNLGMLENIADWMNGISSVIGNRGL